MSKLIVPIEKPKPDIIKFLNAMVGKKIPDRPPLVEYLIDDALMKPIIENLIGRKWADVTAIKDYLNGKLVLTKEITNLINSWTDNQVAFWYHMGYDFVRVEISLPLPEISYTIPDTAKGNEGKDRAWQSFTEGTIKNWKDFEEYPWPKITDNNFYVHKYICDHLPEGMGFITCHAGGVFEHTSRLMGYEHLCLNLIEDPSLVKAVVDKVGELICEYYKRLLELDRVSAILQGEDLGFNTQTLISPTDLRKYFLPWHKKNAQICHEKDRPYYLHSCGRIDAIMEDLIEDVKIDGKHSFQDGVFPIFEAKKRWGSRICLLGGVDIDKLARLELDDLRKYVRKIIDSCSPGARFSIGSGNSIPSYIPVENYLTMLDEALK